MKFKHVGDVARWRLCLGCGACASVCPEGKIDLVDIENDGIRPIVEEDDCEGCTLCLQVCPGIETTVPCETASKSGPLNAHSRKWGHILELWEGYAGDADIRYKGSSGGLCTALSLHLLQSGTAGGVVHIGADPQQPTRNLTYRSLTPEELIRRTGSRYAPASPCSGFNLIESADDSSVFIGKPCDIAGLRKAQQISHSLADKTALAIGFFCAGTPSTQGTLALLEKRGIEENAVSDLRYRGLGWPGMAKVEFKDQREPFKMTYSESWGFIQQYRPFRCYLCPDLTAELADISVGDPWYRDIGEDEPGRSLILIRTEKGKKMFYRALEAGCVVADKADTNIIYRSQKNLLGKRQEIWGRLLAMKLLGIPYPRLSGFSLYQNWRSLTFGGKSRSFAGTAKRIIYRRYHRPLTFDSEQGGWR